MRIIGIKLKEGSSSMIKNLHADTWYPFGRYVEPSEGNGWKCNSRATNGKTVMSGCSRKDAATTYFLHCGELFKTLNYG